MASNDVPTVQATGLAEAQDTSLPPTEPPAAPFATTNISRDLAPPSSRSSFTRVGDDDERRTTQITSHDPIPFPHSTHCFQFLRRRTDAVQLNAQIESPSPPELSTDEHVPQMPQTYLTFLLISGKRRTMAFEPDTSIGRVKELVWNSWPADWQHDRPPAPSYLRVLYLGRMLQDDETLSSLKLPTHTVQQPTPSSTSSPGPTPTIVHLSIRPYPPPGDGDAIKKKKKRVPDDASGKMTPIMITTRLHAADASFAEHFIAS
ncbi:ubiquitin-related domain-containing protein [Pholiota molesta]|nr:ubiquitin-related domain-containing protein [Pholiota molesta]